jgi:hypothetical protein
MSSSDHMRPFETRALTEGEIALGRIVFADEIAWKRIRIFQAPALGFGAMVPLGRTIVFSRWRASRDFALADREDQGWFVHELMHVWQAACGIFLGGAKLKALGAKAYAYAPKSAPLAAYNIESQAEIARHLFLARTGAGAKGAPPRAWLEEIWLSRSHRPSP